MPIKDYSTDPDLNVSISGINIAEGCPPSGINNAIRQLMADVKVESEAQAEAITAASSALEAFADQQAAKDEEQDEAIAEAKSSAEAAGQAAANAQSSADAAQASADAALAKGAVLPGSVIAWAANSTPDGYLLCNGAVVSRTTYKALFDTIGTIYGAGDGATTFSLPDMNGRVIQGTNGDARYIAAGLPNSQGWFTMRGFERGFMLYSAGAPFYINEAVVPNGPINGAGSGSSSERLDRINFDLSRDNAIYGASNTVQPPALALRYYIKY